MSGLEKIGFVRKNLVDILASMKQHALNEFGTDFNVGDDSAFMQLAGPFSIELDNLWQAAEAAYDAYTVNGAEGIHLDNYLSFFGVPRQDATFASGQVLIENQVDNTSVVSIDTMTFSDSSGNSFTNVTSPVVIDRFKTDAFKILNADLESGTTYTVGFTADNSSLINVTMNITDEASKTTALDNLQAQLEANVAQTVGKIYRGSDGFYLGFTDEDTFNLLASQMRISMSPMVGYRYTEVDVIATEARFYGVTAGAEISINPSFAGYTSAVTHGSFASGTNVETDAEYRIRAAQVVNRQISSSAVAMVNAILASGADDVIIYENPTASPTTEVSIPYAVHIIVLGGSDQSVAEAIYDTIPINISMDGTEDIAVESGLGGATVTMTFSRAAEVDLDVRLTYQTNNGFPLTEIEQTAVKNALVAYSVELGISDSFSLFRSITETSNALTKGRLLSLTVEVKELNVGAYQSTDFTAAYNEILSLDSLNIALVQA